MAQMPWWAKKPLRGVNEGRVGVLVVAGERLFMNSKKMRLQALAERGHCE